MRIAGAIDCKSSVNLHRPSRRGRWRSPSARNRAQSERLTDSGVMWRGPASRGAGRGIGVGDVAALHLGIDAAHDVFGDRMRGREHREIDLQHGAERVVMAVQRVQQVRRVCCRIFLARLQLRPTRRHNGATVRSSSARAASPRAVCRRAPARSRARSPRAASFMIVHQTVGELARLPRRWRAGVEGLSLRLCGHVIAPLRIRVQLALGCFVLGCFGLGCFTLGCFRSWPAA